MISLFRHPTPQATPNPTTALGEALEAVIQNLTANQQTNAYTNQQTNAYTNQQTNAYTSTKAKYMRDFKRGDPRTFKETSVTQMWLRFILYVFRFTNCPEAQ